jgi:hypothetical protein
MSQTVFLHVGLPKSGTTYIQRVLATHKEALASGEKLLFPGHSWGLQVNATRDVRQMRRGGKEAAGSWRRMVREIHAWPGDAVVSMEWLCAADAAQVARIVGDLAPSRVRVVFTVRDIARTLPSAWQEMVKNRKTWSWSEFLTGVSAEDARDNDAGNRFWPKQDMAAMLDTWGTQVPSEDLVVVTVPLPGSPPELLWERFAGVLGIPPRDYGTALPRHNESLGVESTEVVRRLNEAARGAGFGKEAHLRIFKHVVARRILSARRSQESRLGLPAEYHDWAREAAREQVEAITQRGAVVVGDLEDLHAVDVPGDVTDPSQLDPEALLGAALDAIVGLASDRRELERQVADLERSLERVTGKLERNRATVREQRRRLDALRARVKVFEDRPLRAGVRTRARQVRRQVRRSDGDPSAPQRG